MKIINIEATDLPDFWFQCVYNIIEHGRSFKIDEGSFAGQARLELDFVVGRIKQPYSEPYDSMLPQIPEHYNIPNPVSEGYVEQYMPYLMTGVENPGESYTYGQRLCSAKFEFIEQIGPDSKFMINDKIYLNRNIIKTTGFIDLCNDEYFLNQIELMIWTYKNKGHRNNQMILQVGQPSDMLLKDPCCLRHIDSRIQDGKLHFYPYLRSNDLWSAMAANLAGIAVLQKYCADEIGVEMGEMVYTSKGLHVYDHALELAKLRVGKGKND